MRPLRAFLKSEFGMKKFFLSAASLALMTSAVIAADLPSRTAEPLLPPPSPPMWTGFHAGLNAGATWGNSNTAQWAMYPAYVHPNSTGAVANAKVSELAGSPQISLGSQLGFLGGGQIGYNYQFYKAFVVGAEADIQGAAGATGNGQVVQSVDYTFVSSATRRPLDKTLYSVSSAQKSVDYLGTVRGKIGYLVTPTLQVYGTGGLAYGGVTLNSFAWQTNLDANTKDISPGSNSVSGTNIGWTAGGGVEWMFAPSWSVKAEYLYYDLGNKNFAAGARAAVWAGFAPARAIAGGDLLFLSSTNVSARLNGNIARVGVNYHFNLGGSASVIASY